MCKALGSVARPANKKKYVGQDYPRDGDAVPCVQQDEAPPGQATGDGGHSTVRGAPLSPMVSLLAVWLGRNSCSTTGLCGTDHAGRSGPAATKLPVGITVTSDSSLPPAKRDFKPHKLSPPSPCSPSLIKIERTHVPISRLLEGSCGVYASSLRTGAKFE